MDPAGQGAVRLLTALHEAQHRFSAFGSEQFLSHRSVRWQRSTGVGHGVDPLATVGASFDLDDDAATSVSFGVCVWVRDGVFEVTGDAMVDDPLPGRGTSGNQRWLVDCPDVRTTDLDECIAAVRDHTDRLCAYTAVLDDLGVSRTPY